MSNNKNTAVTRCLDDLGTSQPPCPSHGTPTFGHKTQGTSPGRDSPGGDASLWSQDNRARAFRSFQHHTAPVRKRSSPDAGEAPPRELVSCTFSAQRSGFGQHVPPTPRGGDAPIPPTRKLRPRCRGSTEGSRLCATGNLAGTLEVPAASFTDVRQITTVASRRPTWHHACGQAYLVLFEGPLPGAAVVGADGWQALHLSAGSIVGKGLGRQRCCVTAHSRPHGTQAPACSPGHFQLLRGIRHGCR